MFFPDQAVTVNANEPTRLDPDVGAGNAVSLMLVAQGAGTVVLGDSDVEAATGCRVPVVAGEKLFFDLDAGEHLYGIVASGTLVFDALLGRV